MAKVTATPLFIKDVELTLGSPTGDDYGAHITSVKFIPAYSTVSTQTVDGTTYTETALTGWTAEVVHNQDWSTTGLSTYLYNHAGETLPATFTPKPGAGLPEFTSNLTIAHGEIGGKAGAYAETTVTMGCSKPALGSQA